MSRSRNALCSCPYMPHDDARCETCGHYLAHHYRRKPCNKGMIWGCKECQEDDAKYGSR